MSLRRFIYFVTDNAKRGNFLLRRINMSRFFLPNGESDPPPLEEGRLPPADMAFEPPSRDGYRDLQFMLFAGGSSGRNKVFFTDLLGRAAFYDPEASSIRILSCLTGPKFAPISLTVGNKLYVLDMNTTALNNHNRSFEELSYTKDWFCQPLPPPYYLQNYVPDFGAADVTSYAVVGGSSIWLSRTNVGTYSFDTVSRVWSMVGDWALPFCGHAQYVPEHNLWFGVPAPSNDSDDEADGVLCSSDLNAAPPTVVSLFCEPTPREWITKSSYLVHLGRSRFCHVRFFHFLDTTIEHCYRRCAVLTGIEVERCKEAGGKLVAVKHISKQYNLGDKHRHWVL
ncbi:hypothetical protein ACP4OV_031191 [Aristida adscensionis]